METADKLARAVHIVLADEYGKAGMEEREYN